MNPSNPKKYYVFIGDLHLDREKFADYIAKASRSVVEKVRLAALEHHIDAIFLLGDILHTPELNAPLLELLVDLLLKLGSLTDRVYIITGNHDFNSDWNMNALRWLNGIQKVQVIEEPTVVENDVLLVPHSYNGYEIKEKHTIVAAHLGIQNIPVDVNYLYNRTDTLRWSKDVAPKLIVLGHIHTPIFDTIDETDLLVVGNICPSSWAENSEQRKVWVVDSNGKIKNAYEIEHPKLITVDDLSLIPEDPNILIRFKLPNDITKLPKMDNIIEVVPPKASRPVRISKGETIEEIVKSISNNSNVDATKVKKILNALGLKY